jgi:glycosyltransferase involved in cell wall biosynthesis
VELVGWKTQSEVAELMRAADIFAFPSIRELGAGVVVEAMASGLACVVVDYGAPGALIGTDRGIKVPLGNFDQLARAFGDAFERLVADENATAALASAARRYAIRHYAWDAKARSMLQVYEWALAGGMRPTLYRK